jgi:hypothetical protein
VRIPAATPLPASPEPSEGGWGVRMFAAFCADRSQRVATIAEKPLPLAATNLALQFRGPPKRRLNRNYLFQRGFVLTLMTFELGVVPPASTLVNGSNKRYSHSSQQHCS